MGAYSFQKLYADVVAPDGTVCITYASWLSVLGRRWFLGGVELYDPAGGRSVDRASRGTVTPTLFGSKGAKMSWPSGDLTVELALPSGPFTLTLRNGWRAPLPDQPLPGLTWSVRAPRAEATARWSDRAPLSGTGYADWVTLDRVTRRYPLQSLEWGRIHLADETALFTRLTLRTGQAWERGLLFDGTSETCRTRLADRVYAGWRDGALSITTGGDQPVTYRLHPARCLHNGAPYDRERFPRLWERALIGLVTGSSHETRWLSHAYTTEVEGSPGWAMHEEVRFGGTTAPAGTTPTRQEAQPIRLINPAMFGC